MFWTELGTQIVFGVAFVGVLFKTSVFPEKGNYSVGTIFSDVTARNAAAVLKESIRRTL